MAITEIGWTHRPRPDGTFMPGFTFNPWIGCTKVAPGCAHCYAEADFDLRRGAVKWGPNGTRKITSASYWQNPIKWNKLAEAAGERRMVFCASLADVFEEWGGAILNNKGKRLYHNIGNYTDADRLVIESQINHPVTMDDLRRDLFKLIYATPWLDWLMLTKRPENILRMWPSAGYSDAGVPGTLGRRLFIKNVWLGTSISDQATADRNITELVKCRGLSPVFFLSAEPLLGPIDLLANLPAERMLRWHRPMIKMVDWLIVGGESGQNARECHVPHIRSLTEQCRLYKTPCYTKQLGSFCSSDVMLDGCSIGPNVPMGDGRYRLRLKHPNGVDWDEWPVDMRIREFPVIRA